MAGADARFRFAGDAADQHRLLRALLESDLPVTSFAESTEGLQAAYFESVRGAPPEKEGAA